MKILPHELDVLHWNSIVVIESLSSAEKTGQELFDSKLARRCLQHGYQVAYVNVVDKSELFAALSAVKDSILEGHLPVLHFEMHGNSNGLELESDELVSWFELGNYLRVINTAMNNTLVVVLAACFGIEIGTQVMPMFRAPFRCAVAPMEAVSRGVIEEGFDDFYDMLPRSLPDAIRALNNYSDDSAFRYLDITELFDLAWTQAKELYNSPGRVNELVDYMLEIGFLNPGDNEDVIRQSWLACLLGGEKMKWGVYRYFMMAETFPDEGENVFFYLG
jgi:hypothetical protein